MKSKSSHSFINMTLFCVCAFLLAMMISPESPVQACSHDSGDSGTYQVLLGPLRIRAEPNGETVGVLLMDNTFTVTEFAEAGGYLWGRHDFGWTALHTLDCNTVFSAPPGYVPPTPDPAGDMSTDAQDGSIVTDNLCYTVWTFCNTGTDWQRAYYWRLGWFTAEVQKGRLSGDPARMAAGATPVPTEVDPEVTAEPSPTDDS